jgi:phage protein U
MYAQLGSVRFEGLKSFDRYSLKSSANIAQHARIDGKPRLQKIGDNLDELSLDMLLHSRFCTPEQEKATLKAAMDAGEVMPLITGAGDFVGNFVIQGIDESIMHTDAQGRIIMSRLAVSLIEHYESSNINLAVQAATRTAFANAANSPVTVPFVLQSQSAASKFVKDITDTKSGTDAAAIQLERATVAPAEATTRLKQAQEQLKKAQDAAQKAESSLQALQDKVNNFTQLKNNLELVLSNITQAIEQARDGSVSGALAATRSTQGALGGLTGASSNVAVLKAIRRG